MKEKLHQFMQNNSITEFIDLEHKGEFEIIKPWNDETFSIVLTEDVDFEKLKDIILPTELNAVFHKDKQTIEYIFTPLSNEHDFLNRKTKFNLEGTEFNTEFNTSSDVIEILARGFRKKSQADESHYRNLELFNEYYRRDDDDSYLKSYFKDKKPISFFVTGDFSKINDDLITLSKHLNVYMKFFDREAPVINIINIDSKITEHRKPCYTQSNDFPNTINISRIDPIALDLILVGNETNNLRLKYLFYYQVLEYFAYYHLDKEIRKKISNILKSPDIINSAPKYTKLIIEELKDSSNTNNKDKEKLNRLIIDHVRFDDITNELENNIETFCNDLEFEGKFKLERIFKNKAAFEEIIIDEHNKNQNKSKKDTLINGQLATISDRISRIRNVLVHVRENHENKVILPTKMNDKALIPYVYLIRRIAETVAIKYEA